jgi:hypothetical protein
LRLSHRAGLFVRLRTAIRRQVYATDVTMSVTMALMRRIVEITGVLLIDHDELASLLKRFG